MKFPGKLILAVGMPRAGSGWHYNLVHDLVLAGGGKASRQIRSRFFLKGILTEVNCNIGALTPRRLLLALLPTLLGITYTIKAHAGPKPLARWLIRRGWLKVTYIYRDPRDALLSAYEYGQRGLEQGRRNPFSHLDTIDKAIEFMRDYVRISQAWLAVAGVLSIRYEDLLDEYDGQANQLAAFLGLDASAAAVQAVVERYRPERSRTAQPGMHFSKGKKGRFEQVLSSEQKEACRQAFQHYLEQTGYTL